MSIIAYPTLAGIFFVLVITLMLRAEKMLTQQLVGRFFTITGIGLLFSNLAFPGLAMFLGFGPIIITASLTCFLFREDLA